MQLQERGQTAGGPAEGTLAAGVAAHQRAQDFAARPLGRMTPGRPGVLRGGRGRDQLGGSADHRGSSPRKEKGHCASAHGWQHRAAACWRHHSACPARRLLPAPARYHRWSPTPISTAIPPRPIPEDGFARHADGSLTAMAGSPFAAGGAGLASQGAIQVTPDGRYLLVDGSGMHFVSVASTAGTSQKCPAHRPRCPPGPLHPPGSSTPSNGKPAKRPAAPWPAQPDGTGTSGSCRIPGSSGPAALPHLGMPPATSRSSSP